MFAPFRTNPIILICITIRSCGCSLLHGFIPPWLRNGRSRTVIDLALAKSIEEVIPPPKFAAIRPSKGFDLPKKNKG